MLFCHVTSRVPTDKHQDLLGQKGGQGFPHLVFMDAAGNVIAEHEGQRTAAAFAGTGEKAKAFLALKAKAEKGDKAALIDVTLAELELGHIGAEEADKKLAGATLSKEQKEKIDGLKAAAEVRDVLKTVTQDPATQAAAGKKFLEMKKAGKPAPADEQGFQAYWILIMNNAEKDKDVPLFEECLKNLKDRFGSLPQAQAFLKAKERSLQALKAEAEKK